MARLTLTSPGEDVGVQGNVTIFGTSSAGEVITVFGGNIVLDGSFNRGGDRIVLSGDAGDYTIRLVGSSVELTNGSTTARIPIGPAGMDVTFGDATLELRIDTVRGSAVIGDQEITTVATPVTGEGVELAWVAAQQTYDLGLPDTASAHEYAVADFNGDGLDDILLASFLFPLENEGVPIKVLLNQGDGAFADGTSEVFGSDTPVTVHPRGMVVADFNGDGRADVFIADHGYDTSPFPGAQNTLLLSTANGLEDATANLPQLADFTHSAAGGDVDGDGDIDLVVMNLYGGSPPTGASTAPYILLNDGSGDFTRADDLLPAEVVARDTRQYTASLLFDADDDGDNDLFLGSFGNSAGDSSRIYLNDGSGDFSEAAEILLPAGPNGADAEWVMAAQAGDLDGDGNLDLVVTINLEDADPYVQILMGDGNGGFEDETANRLPQDLADTDNWTHSVELVDLNGDGALDILARDSYQSPVFLNNGNGVFAQVESSEFDYGGWGTPEFLKHIPVDVDGDGRKDVVADASGDGYLWTFSLEAMPIA